MDDITYPLPKFVQEERSGLDPYELFQLYFTDELFQHFYESTRYNADKISQKTKTKRFTVLSQLTQKKSFEKLPITKSEIKVYLGILLFMSLNKVGSYVGNQFIMT